MMPVALCLEHPLESLERRGEAHSESQLSLIVVMIIMIVGVLNDP